MEHSSLFDPFVSYKENEVLRIWPQASESKQSFLTVMVQPYKNFFCLIYLKIGITTLVFGPGQTTISVNVAKNVFMI